MKKMFKTAFTIRHLCRLSLLGLLVATAGAEENDKKVAITDPAQADADFLIQGEYRGYLRDESGFRRPVGLQVCALGGGQFAGVEYPGGLPGSGWNQQQKFELTGDREGDAIWMASQRCMFIINGKCAQAISIGGQSLGQLRKVTRISPTFGARPPCGAKVLFGNGINEFKDGEITDEGWLKMGTETLEAYQDFSLHLEFRLPYMPYARGQGRANSGVYLQSRYEVQILDSFSLEGEFNECGALYRTRPPDVNMCFPPLQWQTYEIHLRSPRFASDGQTKLCDGRISIVHNGVTIHNNVLLPNKTGAGKQEGPNPLPTKLQDHGNPVVYRNIWIVDRNPTASSAARRIASRVPHDLLDISKSRTDLAFLKVGSR